MFAHSIRWRLQFWLGLVLFAVLFGFGVSVFRLESVNRLQQLDVVLERRLGPLHYFARASYDGSRGTHATRDDETTEKPKPTLAERQAALQEILSDPRAQPFIEELETNGIYFAIWSRDGGQLYASPQAPSGFTQLENVSPYKEITLRTRGGNREVFQYSRGGDVLAIGQSLESFYLVQRSFLLQLVLIGAGVLVIGLGGGWWIASHAIRPIEEISSAARRISAGNLSERVTAEDSENEIGRLATVLNDTFARLESAFVQQKRFVADAAHELRTPLAVLITEAQTTLGRERSAAEYRESIESSLGTAQQMRALIESLLELARLESEAADRRHGPVDLAELVTDCVEQLSPLAAKRDIGIDVRCSSVLTDGDESQLARVIKNLLGNAIRYNDDGGFVRVSTEPAGDFVRLDVTNSGDPISEEDLPHVFDRFYRADKARTRAEGHSGLGLAISKAIVEAHGGTIDVSSANNETTFAVRLPRTSES